MRNFEARWEAQANRLLRIPINENPFEECSGNQIALVGKLVEALRASACKVEMVKHLIDFHGSPLALQPRRQIPHPPPILFSLLLHKQSLPTNCLLPYS